MIRSPPPNSVDASSRTGCSSTKTVPKCITCNVVINELLTYIVDKVDTLPETAILQICTSAYTSEEIEDAREIIMGVLAPNKRKLRRKEGAEQKSLQEIIKYIKEHDPDVLPIFVARNIKKLPPVTFDHIDITAFLKEMTLIKSELKELKSRKTTTEIPVPVEYTKDIETLRNDIEEIKGSLRNINDGFVRGQPEKTTYKQHNVVSKQHTPKTPEQTTASAQSSLLDNNHQLTKKHPSNGSAASSLPVPALERSLHRPSYRDIAHRPTETERPTETRALRQECADTDGFTLVQRKGNNKRISRNMCGTARGICKIQAADLYVPIYVSRIAKSVTSSLIEEHFTEKGQMCKDIQLLAQKQDTSFNSFKVLVPKNGLNLILSNDFWPEGIKYRIYREHTSYKSSSLESKNLN